MIPNSAFSWQMQVWNACWHHRPKPLPEEGIDGSHNTPAGTAYIYDGNRLSDGSACKLAVPPPVLPAKNQTGMAAPLEVHELSII